MKIYTRTGDKGETGLFSGKRVSKANDRVEAYGTVDELNACVGLLRDHIEAASDSATALRSELLDIQSTLFALGAALADDRPEQAYAVPGDAVGKLETRMDAMNEHLPPMTHFVLPGGAAAVSFAHLARTVCRRAERRTILVAEVDATVVVYLNRLSDYLFVAARYLTYLLQVPEIKWESGK